ELRRGSGGACRLDYFRVSPDNGSAIGYEIFDQACAGTLVFDQKRCPAVLLAKPRYGTPELGIVDALAPQIEQVAVVTAGEPDRSNGIVGQLRAFHRGIETDDQKIVIAISWSDLVFLELVRCIPVFRVKNVDIVEGLIGPGSRVRRKHRPKVYPFICGYGPSFARTPVDP